jgi:hypothetical protein
MLGDGVDHWFVALDFTPANPSNHIHVNELRAGKLIDEKMLAPGEVDSQSFVTWLETIDRITILFPPNISWAIIKH